MKKTALVLICAGFLFLGFVTHAQAATNVYYSVGQNTADHKTGTPTLTISGGTGTFSVAQTATNMGVGDKVTFNTSSVCYISGKQSTSIWNLITATGTTCPDVTDATVNSIAHAFASLHNAIGDTANTVVTAPYLNNTSLVAADVILNIPCYYDSGPNTNALLIRNITTDATRYIRIYTATSTATEVNQSQRHEGKWDSTKYNIVITDAASPIDMRINYITFDGLQIKNITTTGTAVNTFYINTLSAGANSVTMSNNIIWGVQSAGTSGHGISNGSANNNLYAHNNIIYGFNANSSYSGLNANGNVYAYNNTLTNNARGLNRNSGVLVAKNNIAYNNPLGGDYVGTFSASSTHNLSKDATAPAFGTYYRSKILTFTSTSTPGSEDFHLVTGDTDALNKATDLSTDPDGFISFNTDIDGQTRSGTWDLGADDLYVAPDTEDPVITAFTIPTTATSRIISISTFTATDNVGVTGYLITESATEPAINNPNWSATAQTTYTITGAGTSHTLYAWTYDASENISASVTDTITITPTATSCSQAHIQAQLNVARDGDTILVPAGSCTWTTGNGTACASGNTAGICVQKGIKLQGGSGGTTTITFGSGFTHGGLQIYPDAESLTGNATFEVSGFTFDGNGGAMNNEGLLSIRSSNTSIMHNLKIHDNLFKNVTNKAVVANGAVNGVIYNNIFTDVGYSVVAYGGDVNGWNTFTRSFGQSDNLFIEDNTINFTTDMSDVGGTDHGQGAPGFVFRYNTFDLSNTSGGYLFIIHGLQSMAVTAGYTAPSGCGYDNATPSPIGSCDETVAAAQQWSTVKSEYYGNSVTGAASLNKYMAHRGSWLMMFLNDVAATGSAPTISYDQYSCDSSQSPSTPVFSQHVQNSYIFDNLYNNSTVPMIKGLDFCGDMSINRPYTITQNVDYWNQNSSFDGATGVGVGTFANRPTICTVGVGYWATNQNTSNLTGLVGANPSTPISGTFYKCTAPNTWTSYYTPYTYPHPLRNETELVSPQVTAFTIPTTASSLTVDITTFTATDNVGVTGYKLTETSTPPLSGDSGWSASALTTYTFSSAGSKTLYAWAKDAAGNISASSSDTVTITLPSSAPTPTPTPSSGGGGGPMGLISQLPNTNNLGTNSLTIASLQNQITQLTLQLNTLLSQRNIGNYTPYTFTRDLYYRMVGNDVLHLQQYLNTRGFLVTTTGPGSPGNETTKFGLLTYKALQKFQKSVGLPPTGFFGPMTRNYINKK